MHNPFSRTALLLGAEAISRLSRARVAVFGLGGVGGHAAEALARSGVGSLDLFDNDVICPSNLNRQLFATGETLGQLKTEAARARILSIHADILVRCYPIFYTSQTADAVDITPYDYIIDAVDTVDAKLSLAERCHAGGIPLLSVMGCGNKLDPTKFIVCDIFETSVCPLARVMRHELKKRGVPKLQVVYSTETAMKPLYAAEETSSRRQIPGSTAFVPAVAGLIAAGVVVRALAGIE